MVVFWGLGSLSPVQVVGAPTGSAPAAGPSPSAPASARAVPSTEDVPESYLGVLAALKSRSGSIPTSVPNFRFWRIDVVQWPRIQIKEVTTTPRGPGVVLEGSGRAYCPGDAMMGTKLISIANSEVVLEMAGERRTFNVKRGFPDIVVRSIREVEGEWTVYIEGERRPLYVGDVVREVKVIKLEPDGATLQFGTLVQKLAPKVVRPPFPALAFTGIIQMSGGRVVLVRGRRDPLRAGDVYEGVKVVDIGPSFVVLEFEGERRTVPIR